MTQIAGKQLQDGAVTKAKTSVEIIVADGTRSFTAAVKILGLDGTPSLTVNEDGKDSDTRIEGIGGRTHQLFVDASAHAVIINGIGESAPTSTHLLVAGQSEPARLNVAAYSATATHQGILRLGHFRGTQGGVFSNMASGDYLGSILFDGSQSGAQPDGSVGVALEVRTTEAWSSGAHGAKLSIQTTPNLSITQVERIGLNATECVLNDSGANYDFRIESDGNATAFFLDANHSLLGTTGAIGLFTGSPTSGFDVRTSQSINRTTIADADYTVLDTDYLVAYTSISAPHRLATAPGQELSTATSPTPAPLSAPTAARPSRPPATGSPRSRWPRSEPKGCSSRRPTLKSPRI